MKERLENAEDLSEVFDQQHLVREWSRPQRNDYVQKLLTAMSRNMALLRGVSVEELVNKQPEEQGSYLLRGVLGKPQHEKNIQMLVHLESTGFLKEKEPPGDIKTPASLLSAGIHDQPTQTTSIETTSNAGRNDDLPVD